MVLSKLIIGSHYKVLGFTSLFFFHFAEKCVIWTRFLFEILLFLCVREKPAFPFIYRDSMYGQLKETSFYYMEEWLFVVDINVCKKSSS